MMTKPLRVAQIDWSNPLTKGLVGCIPFNEMFGNPRDIVTKSTATLTTNATWTSGGLSRGASGVVNLGTIPLPSFFSTLGTGDFTMMFVGYQQSATSGYGIMESATVGTSSLGLLTFGGGIRFRVNGISSTTSLVGSGVNWPMGRVSTLFGVRKGTSLSVYIDGNGNTATTTLCNVEALTTLNIGANNTTNGVNPGERQMVVFWNRPLTFMEVRQLTTNPWQLLASSNTLTLLRLFGTPVLHSLGYVNVGGVWKTVNSAYVNVGGVWKDVTAIYCNVGGTWKGLT